MLNCLPVNPRPKCKSSRKDLIGALGSRTPSCNKACGQWVGLRGVNLAGLAFYRWRAGQVQGKCLVGRQEACQEILSGHWLEFRRSALSCTQPLDGGSTAAWAIWKGIMEEVPLVSGL